MSRSLRNKPWKCSCCRDKGLRKEARGPVPDPELSPGDCGCCPPPTKLDLEYEQIEREYDAWLDEQELNAMCEAE